MAVSTGFPEGNAKTCTKCGETKPLPAFQFIASTGTHRGHCRECENARLRAAYAAGPSGPRHQLRQEIKDDLWTALATGRSRRAPKVTSPHRSGTHPLQLKDGCGYISVTELACRCLEREAVSRAAKACKSHADAAEFIRVFEQETAGLGRRKSMQAVARTYDRSPVALPSLVADIEPAEDDPFAEAFGDWAPAWMTGHASMPPYI